jgi:hypothetical protein
MKASEAFAAIALVAVACDGVMDPTESQALRRQLEARSPYRELSLVAMGHLFDGLLERLREVGWSQLLSEALPALTEAQQETAFAMAAELVHADHEVEPMEEEFLSTMARQLTLPADRADQILDVIRVMHRDALAD